jgi:hypothetical protein
MEPESASPVLTRWIVLAGAFLGAALVLLLRDGQPDGGVAQASIGSRAQALGLLGGPIFAALVYWHTFHRRCGPEWKCLE